MAFFKKIFPFVLSASIGFTCGAIYGITSINNFMSGKYSIPVILFTPSKNTIDTVLLLNSSSELKRLEGYYSYKEAGLCDVNFLYERYKIEDSLIIKKTIIWILENNKSLDLISAYRKFYDVSPKNLKIYLQQKIDDYNLEHQKK